MTKPTQAGALALAAFILTACDGDATGPDAGATGVPVAIRFETGVPAGARTSLNGGSASLTIDGTNGSLRLDDVRLVVAEFELKRQDDDLCDGLSGSDEDGCEKFEAGPFFVDVPLEGGSTLVVSRSVPADTYRRFDFEVEDLDDDEGDPSEAARIREVLEEIRSEIPEWPRDASMLAVGEFLPSDGGAARPFRVFFEAEIEVERRFEPPIVVAGDDAQRTISVSLEPALWFGREDGTVLDLSAFDGTLVEFEVEIEHGFQSIEFD